MATNYVQPGDDLNLPVTSGKVSGDPEMVGDLPVVLLTDADDSDMADCRTRGVFDLAVKAVNDAGSSAVAVGDTVYKDGDEINKDAANGSQYGIALGAVTAGQTATVPVKLNGK